jgi:hypothetical protein
LASISKDELKAKHLVIFKFDKKTRQAKTGYAFSKEQLDYLNNSNEPQQARDEYMNQNIQEWTEKSGLSENQIKNEIKKGRLIHIVSFNPMEIMTGLDWSLNDFLHEINFHLIGNINGKVRTSKNQDHKEVFMYDNLSDINKKRIDAGESVDFDELPKESEGYKLYDLILKRIQEKLLHR